MRYWTFEEAINKVELDLDLQDEGFITNNEWAGIVNEAIDEAEAEIHTIHEDYFRTSDTVTLVNGTASYAMPTNIYANKVREVVYRNGSKIYEVYRLRSETQLLEATFANYNPTSEDLLRWLPKNDSVTDGVKMVFFPTPMENGEYITRWYLRNANRIPLTTEDGITSSIQLATKIDIPEFTSFILQFMKVRAMEKEGHPLLDKAIALLERQRKLMVDTLTQMVPDNNDRVLPDTTHYEEHL